MMRLFVGIDLDIPIRAALAEYMAKMRRAAPGVRFVSVESLHVTLKFIGNWPDERLEQMKRSLSAVAGPPIEIGFRGIGFFAPRAPRVFWVGVHANESLPGLAAAVDHATAQIGVPREERGFNPHLTLARSGSGRPQGSRKDGVKSTMYELQAYAEALPPPDFGTMTAQEFFLYESKLSPAGAKYAKIGRFPLGTI